MADHSRHKAEEPWYIGGTGGLEELSLTPIPGAPQFEKFDPSREAPLETPWFSPLDLIPGAVAAKTVGRAAGTAAGSALTSLRAIMDKIQGVPPAVTSPAGRKTLLEAGQKALEETVPGIRGPRASVEGGKSRRPGRGGRPMPVPEGLGQEALHSGIAAQLNIPIGPGAQALDIGAVRRRALLKTPEGWVMQTATARPGEPPEITINDRAVVDPAELEALGQQYIANMEAQAKQVGPEPGEEGRTALGQLADRFAEPQHPRDLLRREELLALPPEQRLQEALRFSERPAWQQALLKFVSDPVTPEESQAIDLMLGETR